MADLTTILTTAIEHAPSTAAVVTAYKAAQPFLAKIFGPGADEIGEIGRDYIKGRRAKNIGRTLADADKLLTEVGREPQEVPLDVAVPLLEAASLQENPTLADLWAALLANAADPAQQAPVQPSFASILKELTAYDALLLEGIARCARRSAPDAPVNVFTPATTIKAAVAMPVQESVFHIALDNLGRLNLTLALGSKLLPDGNSETGFHPSLSQVGPGKEKITITHLGLAFLAAVTPPTK